MYIISKRAGRAARQDFLYIYIFHHSDTLEEDTSRSVFNSRDEAAKKEKQLLNGVQVPLREHTGTTKP